MIDSSQIGSWAAVFESACIRSSINELDAFLTQEESRFGVFPPRESRFKALELCSLEQTRVVILGQDPYHGEGQAHGLAFSVPTGISMPPSLRNIAAEIWNDPALNPENAVPMNQHHGNLESWAQQGVMLLNVYGSVRKHSPGSHRRSEWEEISQAILQAINLKAEPCVFMLWGQDARGLKPLIDAERHLILESAHPSPLSAYRGFKGSRPFSRCNAWLRSKNRGEIDWLSPWRFSPRLL